MKIEVSNGEILDKISILTIKKDRITDSTKRENVYHEFKVLLPYFDTIVNTQELGDTYYKLHEVNRELWNVEDRLRELETSRTFNPEFIEQARSVYYLNDRRAKLKKQINTLSGSDIIEEKSYTDYK
jgi:hypothetical protein|tara:strand:- start:51 stop:431 length:381 start_codon:yes stop_codon:yes gene_type:complete